MPKHFRTGHTYTPNLHRHIGQNVIPGEADKGAPRNKFHGKLVKVEKVPGRGRPTWRVTVERDGELLVGDFHPRVWTYFKPKPPPRPPAPPVIPDNIPADAIQTTWGALTPADYGKLVGSQEAWHLHHLRAVDWVTLVSVERIDQDGLDPAVRVEFTYIDGTRGSVVAGVDDEDPIWVRGPSRSPT